MIAIMRILVFFIMLVHCFAGDPGEEFAKLKNEMAAVKNRLQVLESKVAELPILKENLQECKSSLHNLTQSIPKEMRPRARRMVMSQPLASSNHVAFYAHLSKDIGQLGEHQAVVFDTVRYNDGGAYNSLDGEFTARVPGTHMFIWTVSVSDHTFIESELVVNGVVFGHVIGDAFDHDDWAVATGFAIVKLNLGDTVWIRSGTFRGNIPHLSGVGLGTSSFAGFLIY